MNPPRSGHRPANQGSEDPLSTLPESRPVHHPQLWGTSASASDLVVAGRADCTGRSLTASCSRWTAARGGRVIGRGLPR